jgi:hypothetical protein
MGKQGGAKGDGPKSGESGALILSIAVVVAAAAIAFAVQVPLPSSGKATDPAEDDIRDGVMGALTEASKERKFVLLLLAPTQAYSTNKWAEAYSTSTEIDRLLSKYFVFRFVDLSKPDNGIRSLRFMFYAPTPA